MPNDRAAGLRARAGRLLITGAALAVATPIWVGFTSDLETYLLHPGVLVPSAVPFAIAAALWLPRGGRLSDATVWRCAAMLCGLSAVVAGAVVVGALPMDGDMVALGFLLVTASLTAAALLITAVAHGLRPWRRRREPGP